MVIKAQGDWIKQKYQILNSFPFVIGVLYYTEVQTEEKQTRFIHALELKKFGLNPDQTNVLPKLMERDQTVFFPLQEVFIEDEMLFQVYHRLEGYLLAHYIKKHFPFELKEVLSLMRQITDCILRLYQQDQFAIVHPQNIIINSDKVVRFLYGGYADSLPKGMMLPKDKKAQMLYDSYGLGVLMYQMITGNSPMANGLKIPPISEYLSECPAVLDELVIASLSFDMEKRPTLEEFREKIDQLIRNT